VADRRARTKIKERKRAVWKGSFLGAICSKTVKNVYTLADLENLGRKKSKTPIRLGVLGDPVAHSRSPQMQNTALEKSGLAFRYARFQIAPGELQAALELLPRLDFVGVNLTVRSEERRVGKECRCCWLRDR